MNKSVVYTANFGCYDFVSPVDESWKCDFLCFTDSPSMVCSGWKIVQIDCPNGQHAILNRYYKMHPHLFFTDYDYSLYIDSHIVLMNDPAPLFNKYLTQNAISLLRHYDRDCVYDEGRILVERRGIEPEKVYSQLTRYDKSGFPKNFGLTENGIIFRRHMDPTVIAVMSDWWDEFRTGVPRDQISLPFVLWKHGFEFGYIDESPRVTRDYFDIKLHHYEKSKSLVCRLCRIIDTKKHRNFFYFIFSYIISLLLMVKFKN